jgi:exopolysaccharide production protein ExoQ
MTKSIDPPTSKSSSETTSLLEIACLAFLIFFGQQLDIPGFLVVASNAISYLLVALLVGQRLERVFQFGMARPSLLLLVGLILASVIWSSDPLISFRAASALCRSTLLGIYIASRYSIRVQMQILAWVMLLTLSASLIMAIVAPSYAYQVNINSGIALKGILAHKQTFGICIGLATSVFISSFFIKILPLWLSLCGFGLAFALAILSASKTSLIIVFFLIASTVVYKTIRQSGLVRAAFLGVLGLLSAAIALLISMNIGTILIDYLGKDLELNGRVPLWELAIVEGLKQPWLGYGYNGFWTTNAANYVIHNSWAGLSENVIARRIIFHSHNGFIDFFLQLGVIGCAIFLICFSMAFLQSLKLSMTTRKLEHFWVLQVLCVSIIANISESILFAPNSIFSILFVSLSISVTVQLQAIRLSHIRQQFVPKITESQL